MSEEIFRWVIAGGVAIATLSTLMTAVVCILIFRVAGRVGTKVEDVAVRVEPVVDIVRKIAYENASAVSDIVDRAKEIATNAKNVSDVAKDQAHRWAEVGRDVADRTKAQVARVDAALDETVDQVHHAGDNVRTAVMKPVREASGVIAGIRAAVTSYAQGRRPTIDHITQDEEMFI